MHEFAAVATHDKLKGAIEQRFGGISDSLELGFSAEVAAGLQSEILNDIKSIETRCKGPQTSWDAL